LGDLKTSGLYTGEKQPFCSLKTDEKISHTEVHTLCERRRNKSWRDTQIIYPWGGEDQTLSHRENTWRVEQNDDPEGQKGNDAIEY